MIHLFFDKLHVPSNFLLGPGLLSAYMLTVLWANFNGYIFENRLLRLPYVVILSKKSSSKEFKASKKIMHGDWSIRIQS